MMEVPITITKSGLVWRRTSFTTGSLIDRTTPGGCGGAMGSCAK